MANDAIPNITASPAPFGFTATDLDAFTALSQSGKCGGSILYVGANAATEPTGVTDAHPLPATLRKSDGTEIGIAAAPVRVDPTGTTAQPVTGGAGSQADGHSITLGATTDPAAAGDSSNVGLVALFKRLLARITVLIGQLPGAPTIGGNLKVSLQESNVPQAVTGTFWQTTQAVSIASPVTADTELPVAAALADGAANPTAPMIGAGNLMFNGTTWDRARGDTANGVDVDVTRLPATPAGTNLIGQMAAGPQTGAIYSGTTALTPKFAPISCSSSGDNSLVAGVGSKKIRVHSIAVFGKGTAVGAYFRENTAGNAIFADATNPIQIDKTGAAGIGGFVLPFSQAGWMESSVGNPLVLNLGAAQGLCGGLQYSEV